MLVRSELVVQLGDGGPGFGAGEDAAVGEGAGPVGGVEFGEGAGGPDREVVV